MPAPKKKIMGKGESIVGGVARVSSSSARANARALKAANKPTRASKNPEIKQTEKLAKINKQRGQDNSTATRNAAKTVDLISKAKKEKGLKWEKVKK